MRVLLIEDDISTPRSIEVILKSEGFEASTTAPTSESKYRRAARPKSFSDLHLMNCLASRPTMNFDNRPLLTAFLFACPGEFSRRTGRQAHHLLV